MIAKIWTWIKTHITKKDIIYSLIVLIFIGLLSYSVRSCQNSNDRYSNNIKALTDSITYYQSENGSLVASKTAFESNIKELKTVNGELYSELEDMKIKLKSVTNAVHVESTADFGSRDTVYVVNRDTITGNFYQGFDFSNKWRTLNGNVSLISDSLTVGIKEDKVIFNYTVAMDSNNKIYVKSDNPYVTYNELSGFTVPTTKKKHFSVGPAVGIGYGIFHNKPDLYIGVTASYKLFEF
jgi:hypothetical protein